MAMSSELKELEELNSNNQGNSLQKFTTRLISKFTSKYINNIDQPFNQSFIYYLLLISPFFFWGTAMVAMKGVMPHTTPFFMATVRLLPAGILILLAGVIAQRPRPATWQAWLWIIVFGLVDGTLFQGFLATGLVKTNAGLGSVMIDTQPLAVALLSWWLFQEKIGLFGWLGLAIGVCGIGLIGLPESWLLQIFHLAERGEDIGNNQFFEQLLAGGEWLMLLAALSMAVGTILMPWVSKYADPIMATGWHQIIGSIPLLITSVVTEQDQWVNIMPSGWWAIAYSTVFGSALAYGVFFYFASQGNLTSLSSLTFLTPVFALIFGNLFLGELLNHLQTFGVILTIVSIILINQRQVLMEKLNIGKPREQSS
jgi:drug/metabolite transporter (DMT)-like permease